MGSSQPTENWAPAPAGPVGPGTPNLTSGTPIATFKDGKYPSDGIMDSSLAGDSKYAHTAIFLSYFAKDGKIEGMYILEQSEGKPARVSYREFPTRYEYSVVAGY